MRQLLREKNNSRVDCVLNLVHFFSAGLLLGPVCAFPAGLLLGLFTSKELLLRKCDKLPLFWLGTVGCTCIHGATL